MLSLYLYIFLILYAMFKLVAKKRKLFGFQGYGRPLEFILSIFIEFVTFFFKMF